VHFIPRFCDISSDLKNALKAILVYCQQHELTLDYDRLYRRRESPRHTCFKRNVNATIIPPRQITRHWFVSLNRSKD